MNNLTDFFKNERGYNIQNHLIVVGVNPIVQEITTNPQLFFDLLNTTPVKITLLLPN